VLGLHLGQAQGLVGDVLLGFVFGVEFGLIEDLDLRPQVSGGLLDRLDSTSNVFPDLLLGIGV